MAITNITEAINVLKDLVEVLPAANGNIEASSVTGGTFGGQVTAHINHQIPTASLLRNSKIVSTETNPTVNGEIFWIYG